MVARKTVKRIPTVKIGEDQSVVKAKKVSKLEEQYWAQLGETGLADLFVRELRFHPDRKWRVDFGSELYGILVEVEGGLFGKPVICHNCKQKVMHVTNDGRRFPVMESGRHNAGPGFRADAEKYAAAALAGWMVLRFPGDWIKNGTAIKVTREAIEARKGLVGRWRQTDTLLFSKSASEDLSSLSE